MNSRSASSTPVKLDDFECREFLEVAADGALVEVESARGRGRTPAFSAR